jgi:itaconate CoA-transferase
MVEGAIMLPLQDITIVSLEQAVAAPFATRHLADLGARIIKVERPGSGDFGRHYDRTAKGLSSHFVWVNRSKESLTLNLKSEPGKEILERLLELADVFVHNLAPGAVSRLGFDHFRLVERYPALIVCHISGYGSSGPYRDKKAYDMLVQAEAGLMSVTGTEDSPAKAGIAVADIAAGMYAFSGILTALISRMQSGKGSVIEVSMLEALAEWMGFPAYYSLGGSRPPRAGARHAAIAPYGPFQCGDGRTVLLSVQNEREWQRFCEELLGRRDLIEDDRFSSNAKRVKNRQTLQAIIVDAFSSLTKDQVAERLDKAGIANAEIRSVMDLWAHPQLKARRRWREIESSVGSIPALSPPPAIDGLTPRLGPIPDLGQHTDLILAQLGYHRERIDQLRAEGVI